jgi:predicted dienelactone hydrolase
VHDARIRAVVAAAPAVGWAFTGRGLAALQVPVQLWRGAADEVLPHPWHAELVRRALPQPPALRVVPKAGHYAFLAPCPDAMAAAVPEICLDAPGFDRVAFHRAFNAAVVGFFRTTLR